MRKHIALLKPPFILLLLISIVGIATTHAARYETVTAYQGPNKATPANPNTCVVTIRIQGSGSVQSIDRRGRQTLLKEPTNELPSICDEDVHLKAVSDPGWRFAEWQGNSADDGGKATISVSGSSDLTAVFLKRELRYEPVAPYYDRGGRLVTSIPILQPVWRSLEGIVDADSSPPAIAIWYGDDQNFGQIGMSQKRVNILGTVSDPDNDLASLTIHGINEAGFDGFNVAPSLGIITHWQGHTDDPITCGQPKCGWLPVGMASWYQWDTDRSGNGQVSMWVRHNVRSYDPSGTLVPSREIHTIGACHPGVLHPLLVPA